MMDKEPQRLESHLILYFKNLLHQHPDDLDAWGMNILIFGGQILASGSRKSQLELLEQVWF